VTASRLFRLRPQSSDRLTKAKASLRGGFSFFSKAIDIRVINVYNEYAFIILFRKAACPLAGCVAFRILDKVVVNVYNGLVINLSDLGNTQADRCQVKVNRGSAFILSVLLFYLPTNNIERKVSNGTRMD